MIRLIAAIDSKQGLATDSGIPWKLQTDKKYFKDKMRSGIIIMGVNTYKEFSKPLGDRENFVLVRDDIKLRDGFTAIHNIDNFLRQNRDKLIWIIGGASVFRETLKYAEELYMTQIYKDFNCTKFFPNYKDSFQLINKSELVNEESVTYDFEVWTRNYGKSE